MAKKTKEDPTQTEMTEVTEPEAAPNADAPKQIRKLSVSDNFTRLIGASPLKELIKTAGLRVSGDLHQAVIREVGIMLAKAAKRCLANGRATLRPDDL